MSLSCVAMRRVDRQSGAADHTGFTHLARDQCRMGGPAADRRDDAGRNRKACDVGRAGVGTLQDDRLARRRKAPGAFGIERRTADTDAAGCADA